MNGILLGVVMLASAGGASPTPETTRVAVAPANLSFEFREGASRDLQGSLEGDSFRLRPERAVAQSARAATTKPSKVDRIIAVAAGASIGWVLGGGIGYAVTPKRGPDDDTSGLKGVIIGAPIGAVAGALIGYRLTK